MKSKELPPLFDKQAKNTSVDMNIKKYSRLSEDSSVERMRNRSKSRDANFQQKIQKDMNKSVINRQSGDQLRK